MPKVEPFRVEVDGVPLTVQFETEQRGERYYEMAEQPGDLFKASRCKPIPRHTDLAQRLRGLAFHWRKAGFPTDADLYDLAANEIEQLWREAGYAVPVN